MMTKMPILLPKMEGLVRFVSIAESISGGAEKPAIKMKNCTLFKMLRKTLKTLSMIGVRKEFWGKMRDKFHLVKRKAKNHLN